MRGALRWVIGGLGGLVLLATLSSCSEDQAQDSPGRVEAATRRGPVALKVSVEPSTVTVGEPLRLTIEVVAAEGVEVHMPEPDEDLGTFRVRGTRTRPDVPVADGRQYRHTWTLDTFAAGANEIPAVTVTFTDRRPEAALPTGPPEGEVVSDPLPVTVQSVLTADQGDQDLRDIKHEVRDFVGPDLASLWPVGLVIGLGLVVAGLALFMTRRRAQHRDLEPVIEPHVWARARLDELETRRLVEQGRVTEFYVVLSDIVRQYLERRFGLMAPERTTEEFLREARSSSVLGDDHKTLLSGFLRAADMVKFALHEPSVDESNGALAAARGFVEETTLARPPGSGAVEEAA